ARFRMTAGMRLDEADRATLAGEAGDARRMAMELLVAVGDAIGAPGLLDISSAHIDGCLYHGLAGLDFARKLATAGGSVSVPTTLNVSSLDLLHPGLVHADPEDAERSRAQMQAYESMGCRPTWTCAPYQLLDRPRLGEQIAWGESNAIVFANSVLGARTNRYGDFLDICCALTGRAPAAGLHTDEGRRATILIDVTVPDAWRDEELFYVGLGYVLGAVAGTAVAVIAGLDERADEDRLRALGATAASSGAVGLFHVAGVTPEAPTAEQALGGDRPEKVIRVGTPEVETALSRLGSSSESLGAVSVGTPHASLREIESLAEMCAGRKTRVPFYVNTGRDVLDRAETSGAAGKVRGFGATFVTDTCTYITPIIGEVGGSVMTNSGKWAYYAPGNLGFDVVMGSLADCVESAVRGEAVSTGVSA
ncbi:MAG: aconitase X catalytic domain-containing protein, partial [Acidimicrobiia bacterium]